MSRVRAVSAPGLPGRVSGRDLCRHIDIGDLSVKKFQIAGKRAFKPPSERKTGSGKKIGAWKRNSGAGNFFSGARIFPSRRQDFEAGLPQKAKIPHKTLHKGAVLCKECLFFSLFCHASSKAVSRKSVQIRQKETCSVLGVAFCQTCVSSDTVPGSAATGLNSVATKSLSVRRQNSSALQGRWPEGSPRIRKSVAAYQRGSMKPFFPTEFRLRQKDFLAQSRLLSHVLGKKLYNS